MNDILYITQLVRSQYENLFKIEYLEAQDDELSRLFAKLMWRVHGSDFLACNDGGYLQSSRTLFYCCNMPDRSEWSGWEDNLCMMLFNTENESLWRYVDKWTIIVRGITYGSHQANQLIDQLLSTIRSEQEKYPESAPQFSIDWWGYRDLQEQFRKLSLGDMEEWFGHDIANLGGISSHDDEWFDVTHCELLSAEKEKQKLQDAVA